MLFACYEKLNGWIGDLRGFSRSRIQAEIRANATRPPECLQQMAQEAFVRQVRYCLDHYPAYAEKVREFGGDGLLKKEDWRPEELPVWTRADQKQFWEGWQVPPLLPGVFPHSTGGSTGLPLKFYVTRESYERRMAVADRGYGWAGAQEGRRAFFVWGTPIYAPGRIKRVKQVLQHRLQCRCYFDSFNFSDVEKSRCCKQINAYKPAALVGYAGNLVALARFVAERPERLRWKAETLVTAAEGLHPGDRELLRSTLCDEVFESYGSREVMLIGMECRAHGGYHLAIDNVLCEVVDEHGCPLPPGVCGRIVVTDLFNRANPFVRYEIGDLGVMGDGPCPCGLPFPLLAEVSGRSQEVIRRADGETMTALFVPHLMKEFNWVQGYQLVQEVERNHELTVSLVTSAPLADCATGAIEQKLREKLGEGMTIRFERVSTLQKTASGKTPIVVADTDREA